MRLLPWACLSALVLGAAFARGQAVIQRGGFFVPSSGLRLSIDPEENLFSNTEPARANRRFATISDEDLITEEIPGYAHYLTFQDGRCLGGELIAISEDDVTWRHPDASDLLHFRRAEIRRIVLAPLPQALAPKRQNSWREMKWFGSPQTFVTRATLSLGGGDWLHGGVVFDGQNFAWTRGQQAHLSIPRRQVQWLCFGDRPTVGCQFSGEALDVNDWLAEWGALHVSDGKLTVGGNEWLAAMIQPPIRFQIGFELPRECEDGTRVWLQPDGLGTNAWAFGTMLLRLGRPSITYAFFVDRIVNKMAQFWDDTPADPGPVKYRIFFDGEAQTVVVERNGRRLATWRYTRLNGTSIDEDIRIRGICFDREDQKYSSPLEFHRLEVRPWNGILPAENEPRRTDDSFCTNAGKVSTGTLEAIGNREFRFSGATCPSRIGTLIELPNSPAPLAGAEMRIGLGNAGSFAAKTLEFHDGQATCETSFAPSMVVPLGALQSIAFRDAPSPPVLGDLLVFQNGDELPGEAIAAGTGAPVHWRLADGREIVFEPKHLAGIRFARDFAASAHDEPGATVELRNGDLLHGQLRALDAQHCQFEHPNLGAIVLPRAALRRVYPGGSLATLQAAHHPEAWLRASPSPRQEAGHEAVHYQPWICLDGTCILRPAAQFAINAAKLYDRQRASLRRAIDPQLERFEVGVEVIAKTTEAPQFAVRLLREDGNPALEAGFYANQGNVELRNAQDQIVDRPFSIQDGPPESGLPHRYARVFVDARAGTCDIFFDGRHIFHSGKDAHERLAGSKFDLEVQPYSGGDSLAVFANLRIVPWTGELPQAGHPAAPSVALANGDVTPGAPGEIHGENFVMPTDIGPVEIPMAKTAVVDFGGEMQVEHAPARVRLADGTAFLVSEFQWAGGELKARSALLGDLRLPGNTVSELVYNPLLPASITPPEPKNSAP